jgi:hypothetical protein
MSGNFTLEGFRAFMSHETGRPAAEITEEEFYAWCEREHDAALAELPPKTTPVDVASACRMLENVLFESEIERASWERLPSEGYEQAAELVGPDLPALDFSKPIVF